MKIKEVKSRADAKEFLEVAKSLYRNDKNWICPPDFMIEGVFDPKTNVFFQTWGSHPMDLI